MSIELGEMLRRERIRRKERQRDTAARFGVSQPSYAKWESGTRPDDSRLADIASFLGLQLEEVWRMTHGASKAPATLDELRARMADLERDVQDLRTGYQDARKTNADMRSLLDELKAALLTPPKVEPPAKPQPPRARRPRKG